MKDNESLSTEYTRSVISDLRRFLKENQLFWLYGLWNLWIYGTWSTYNINNSVHLWEYKIRCFTPHLTPFVEVTSSLRSFRGFLCRVWRRTLPHSRNDPELPPGVRFTVPRHCLSSGLQDSLRLLEVSNSCEHDLAIGHCSLNVQPSLLLVRWTLTRREQVTSLFRNCVLENTEPFGFPPRIHGEPAGCPQGGLGCPSRAVGRRLFWVRGFAYVLCQGKATFKIWLLFLASGYSKTCFTEVRSLKPKPFLWVYAVSATSTSRDHVYQSHPCDEHSRPITRVLEIRPHTGEACAWPGGRGGLGPARPWAPGLSPLAERPSAGPAPIALHGTWRTFKRMRGASMPTLHPGPVSCSSLLYSHVL